MQPVKTLRGGNIYLRHLISKTAFDYLGNVFIGLLNGSRNIKCNLVSYVEYTYQYREKPLLVLRERL